MAPLFTVMVYFCSLYIYIYIGRQARQVSVHLKELSPEPEFGQNNIFKRKISGEELLGNLKFSVASSICMII
jgi:hypothetical protein